MHRIFAFLACLVMALAPSAVSAQQGTPFNPIYTVGGQAGGAADGQPVTSLPSLMGCEYFASPPTYTNGQQTTCATDARGAIKVIFCIAGTACAGIDGLAANNAMFTVAEPSSAGGAASQNAVTAAVAGSITAKATAGNLYGFHVTSGASAGYIMAFAANTAPVDGAVTPVLCYALAANTTLDKAYVYPLNFTAGITFVFSTTGCFTKTASATAFMQVAYR